LVGKYHDENAKGGREHRVIVAVHPSVKPDTNDRPDSNNRKES
jgi:hypothetical protein